MQTAPILTTWCAGGQPLCCTWPAPRIHPRRTKVAVWWSVFCVLSRRRQCAGSDIARATLQLRSGCRQHRRCLPFVPRRVSSPGMRARAPPSPVVLGSPPRSAARPWKRGHAKPRAARSTPRPAAMPTRPATMKTNFPPRSLGPIPPLRRPRPPPSPPMAAHPPMLPAEIPAGISAGISAVTPAPTPPPPAPPRAPPPPIPASARETRKMRTPHSVAMPPRWCPHASAMAAPTTTRMFAPYVSTTWRAP
mmetsp:Transcript_34222/g.98673  ORF Transcript_34222/g.98673 Transcript_34222/m.98673 type:complete len:249 (-) Transcript_34222:425-1171(-)